MCITIGYGAFVLNEVLLKTEDERSLNYTPTGLRLLHKQVFLGMN